MIDRRILPQIRTWRRTAKAQVRWARFWWIGFHLYGYIILSTSEAGLQSLNSITEAALYLIVAVLTIGLYIALQLSSPGYVVTTGTPIDTDEDEGEEKIELMNTGETGQHPRQVYHFCSKCRITQPLRSKHCDECNKCVRQYDHHCNCAGTCIGQDNRRLFLLYVMMQTIEAYWNVSITCSLYRSRSTAGEWIQYNGGYLILHLALLGALFLNVLLCFMHWYFVVTNQTTWEFSRRDKITYLKHLPSEHMNPFHRGSCVNLALFWSGQFEKLNDWNTDVCEIPVQEVDHEAV